MTDDSKDDWWRNFKGKTLGPRPELIAEMLKEASVDFYMYRTDQFMEYARSFLKQNVDQNAIYEVKEIGRRNKETQEQLLLKDKRESLTRVQHQLIEHLSILEQQQKVFKKSYHQLVEEESLSSVDMESIDGDTNFFYDLTNAKNKAKVFRVQRDELDTALNDVANQIRSIKHKIDAVNKDRAYIDMKLVYESNYQHDSNDRNGPSCINCGSHGPWNGSICLVCNQKDDGDY